MATAEGAGAKVMAFMEQQYERGADASRVVIDAVLAPWGGTEAYIDAYEAGVRATSDLQLTIAKAMDLEPARSVAATCADWTRDLGATQVSSARWLLDV